MRWSCGADGRGRTEPSALSCSSARSWHRAEPNFYSRALGPCSRAIASDRREMFFKMLVRPSAWRDGAGVPTACDSPSCATRAQRLLGDLHPALAPEPGAQVDDPPANHAMHSRDRASLDHLGYSRPVGVGQARRLPGGSVNQPGGTSALNLTTQSRTICNVTPPIRAASVRLAPS